MAKSPPVRIRTARAVVRRETLHDAEPVADAIAANLDRLAVWMPWAVPDAARIETQTERIASEHRKWRIGWAFDYLIVDPTDGTVLGKIGFPRWRGNALELGYWLTEHAEGRGLATETAGALTDAALTVDTVTGVEIHCDRANLRSNAVPRRLGYRPNRTEVRTSTTSGRDRVTDVWRYPP